MNSHELLTSRSKIMPVHLQRLAYIYIRQSSPKQVEHNRESQINQLQMKERAEALGWSTDRIRVINADLGISASSSEGRDGYKELVADVSLGRVGIILGYEVSRLSRNNGDWYRLLDLAAVFGTLIADVDGVYDTRLYNDRLILGLKGTMSEAELHLLRLRMSAGRMTAVTRGAYRQYLPTALVRLPDGTVVKEPDEQVCHAIELVFKLFEELGSCRQVLCYLRRENILLPRRQREGLHQGQILWKPPTDAAVLEILHSPAYAGAFVYGRRQAEPSRLRADSRSAGRLRRPMAEWLHIQRDAYPAFITWEQYLANRKRLRQNSTLFEQNAERAQGAPRKGEALLQGMVACGVCGSQMRPSYKRKSTHRYACTAVPVRTGGRMCASLHGPSLDEGMAAAFFEAIRPAQLDVLEAVLATQRAERDQLSRQWEERRKRARYQAHLAERQYNAADPDNRLVTAELERRWEATLRERREVEEEYERFERKGAAPALTPAVREQLQNISATLPELWREGRISNEQKKELLRCLISRVIVRRMVADRNEVKIVWMSGHYTLLEVRPPIHNDKDVSGYEEMVRRIHELWEAGLDTDAQIAAQLTKEGHHSARAEGVSSKSVQKIRLQHRWHLVLHLSRNEVEVNGHLTIRGLAERLGVKRNWVYNRIRSGRINPHFVIRNPVSRALMIKDEAELIKRLWQQKEEQVISKGGI